MAFKKHSAQALVQSLVSDLRDQRLKRKTYRYYSGHHSLAVESHDGRLNVEAELNYVPRAVAVLHGRHIVFSEPVISKSHESADRFHATATLGLDQSSGRVGRVSRTCDVRL